MTGVLIAFDDKASRWAVKLETEQKILVKPENLIEVCSQDQELQECVICLEKLGGDQENEELECGHRYHRHCLNTFRRLGVNKLCPMCRKPINSDVEKSVDDIFDEASIAWTQKRYDDAERLWRECCNRDPECIGARSNLGMVLAKLNQDEAAREQFNLALHLRSDFIPVLTQLANLEIKQNRHDVAEREYLQKALNIAPNDPHALFLMGIVLEKKGACSQAIKSYQASLQVDPHDHDVHGRLGILLSKKSGHKATKEATKHLRFALANDPSLGDEAAALSYIELLENKNKAKALEILRRAIRAGARSVTCSYALAQILTMITTDKQTGQLAVDFTFNAKPVPVDAADEALKVLTIARSINPNDDDVNQLMYHLLKQRGQYKLAIALRNKFIKKYPADLVETINFGVGEAQKGNYELAVRAWRQVYALDPPEDLLLDVLQNLVIVHKQGHLHLPDYEAISKNWILIRLNQKAREDRLKREKKSTPVKKK
uniref:RING-type domain-containing protein n=1 Tax=Aureoumbra lagunensis TaxID=44058 RepID=A0A7S3JYR0_9STRA